MYKLSKIFRTALQYKASDIFISTGSKPMLRINGDIITIKEHEILSKKMAEEYLLEFLTEEQKAKFAEELDLDMSLEIETEIKTKKPNETKVENEIKIRQKKKQKNKNKNVQIIKNF